MTRKQPTPTQERLKELFDYDAETGIFTRKVETRQTKARKYGKVGAGRITELGYVMLGVDGVNYNAGALAWAYTHGEWPSRVKYLDGIKTNNRLANLALNERDKEAVAKQSLTQERLKELLHYEPESGFFTWRIRSSMSTPGERAGGLHGFGYRQIGLDYNKYLEHHLAWLYMTGEWPVDEIDHINNVRDDNRWCNLREANRSQNGHNKRLHPKSTTGFPGVSRHGNAYRATISVDKKSLHLGRFATLAETRVARLLAEVQYFGHFTSFDESRDSLIKVDENCAIRLEVVDGRELRTFDRDGNPFRVGWATIKYIIDSWSDGTGIEALSAPEKD